MPSEEYWLGYVTAWDGVPMNPPQDEARQQDYLDGYELGEKDREEVNREHSSNT